MPIQWRYCARWSHGHAEKHWEQPHGQLALMVRLEEWCINDGSWMETQSMAHTRTFTRACMFYIVGITERAMDILVNLSQRLQWAGKPSRTTATTELKHVPFFAPPVSASVGLFLTHPSQWITLNMLSILLCDHHSGNLKLLATIYTAVGSTGFLHLARNAIDFFTSFVVTPPEWMNYPWRRSSTAWIELSTS